MHKRSPMVNGYTGYLYRIFHTHWTPLKLTILAPKKHSDMALSINFYIK